jgi:hypothetical protein
MRQPSDTDFHIDVPTIGAFVFGRRTVRDRFRIGAAVNRLTDGEMDSDSTFVMVAEAYATLQVMMVEGPDNFSDFLDMEAEADDSGDEAVLTVYFEYRKEEVELRKAASKSGEVVGEGSQKDA